MKVKNLYVGTISGAFDEYGEIRLLYGKGMFFKDVKNRKIYDCVNFQDIEPISENFSNHRFITRKKALRKFYNEENY